MNIPFRLLAALLGIFVAAQYPLPAQSPSASEPPADLPKQLVLPPFTRLTVTATYPKREKPNSPARILGNPDMKEAVFTRADLDIQADFSWENGAKTQAFQIQGVLFHPGSLKHPDIVLTTPNIQAMSFSINEQREPSGTNRGNFPGVFWYSPGGYDSTSSHNGKQVHLFHPNRNHQEAENAEIAASVLSLGGDVATPAASTPQDLETADTHEETSLYLVEDSYLPIRLFENGIIYDFTYSAAPGFQINPPQNFLREINEYFKASRSPNP